MEGQVSTRIQATLARRIGNDAGAGRAAACVAVLCEDIGAALTPIVGVRGVAALYRRSLFLTSHEYPVLLDLQVNAQSAMDLSTLTARLTTLSETEATQVGAALLLSFHELLGSLVGASLTERLLRSLWDRPLSDPPTLEPTP